MAKAKTQEVKWLADVAATDFAAAASYLSLIHPPATVNKAIATLKAAPIAQYRATDLRRAAQVELPKSGDRMCRREIRKIEKGVALSPVLLVRDSQQRKVIIADGYHRLCAAYRIDPDVVLHCKIA